MEEVVKLKKKRSYVRSAVTKLVGRAEKILSKVMDNPEYYDHLESILELLRDKEQALRTLNAEVEVLIVKEEEYMAELEGSEDYNDKICVIKSKIVKIMTERASSKSTEDTGRNVGMKVDSVRVKLPEIPLPVFSGKCEEWGSFKLQFQNLIGLNPELSDEQKLYYLSASLSGDARSLRSLEDNFQSLFRALNERYENKKLLVETFINNILNFERINYESSRELRGLIDVVRKNIRALNVLGFARNNLSDVLIWSIVLGKLDRESRKQYELSLESCEVPDLDVFLTFVEKRARALDNIGKNFPPRAGFGVGNTNRNKVVARPNAFVVNSEDRACPVCGNPHLIYYCRKFKVMPVRQRYDAVVRLGLCWNCLNGSHRARECEAQYNCSICHQRHNSLLHDPSRQTGERRLVASVPGEETREELKGSSVIAVREDEDEEMSGKSKDTQEEGPEYDCQALSTQTEALTRSPKIALLSTAIVFVRGRDQRQYKLRALLDSASTACFITRRACELLGVSIKRFRASVSGIGGNSQVVRAKAEIDISNEVGSFSRSCECLVVTQITSVIPAKKLDVANVGIPLGVKLADENYSSPGGIDLLIGSELFFDIMKSERIRLKDENILLQDTVFGYLVTGTLQEEGGSHMCLVTLDTDVEERINKFFDIESLPEERSTSMRSEEEEYCEKHFVKTFRRDENGRFVVYMPMKKDHHHLLGSSREMAKIRLNKLWEKLNKDQMMAALYTRFMDEYLELGHMEEVGEVGEFSYYIPHHGIYKRENATTPLRVVFDASAHTTTGNSLNSVLLNGGNIQQGLFSIILRFRTHRYAFSADIRKMYRQIWVDPSQRNLQSILWKSAYSAPIRTYQLKTVTYGTASAPFLAMRSLRALADAEKRDFPGATETVIGDMYMDDILSGAPTVELARKLQLELVDMLKRGGFELHKWVSNHSELLNDGSKSEYSFEENGNAVKALGMLWLPGTDQLTFKVLVREIISLTKREALSEIAKLFDPLGIIGPVITRAKILMQDLWRYKLNWSDGLPGELLEIWKEFFNKLQKVNQIKYPRFVLSAETVALEIHGFADASERAYGGVVYVRTCDTLGNWTVRLLCSKSRVSPLKTVTIPRLELCAALLLARLVKKIVSVWNPRIDRVGLWTDSTIVLAWLRTEPRLLKTFISNRVAEIQRMNSLFEWRHISSRENPADPLSRGINAEELLGNELWWKGPDCLGLDIQVPEVSHIGDEGFEREFKTKVISCLGTVECDFWDGFLTLSNSYSRLIRILSYCFRFLGRLRGRSYTAYLTHTELEMAEGSMIKHIQSRTFGVEKRALQEGKVIPVISKLRNLDPFLDNDGLLRVGGRLKNAPLDYDAKHQIILPNNNFTELIFELYHKRYLHVGAQGLIHHIRLRYWPLSGKSTARKVVHKCNVCFRAKPVPSQQIMSDLPVARVAPSPPFTNCGIDFCGPFSIKYKNQRKGVYVKYYVAIFICFSSRAIHLETVSELTSEAFVATLKRVVARRGKMAVIYTDNASNFKGASSEIKRLFNIVRKQEESLALFSAVEGIEWKFIPPRSPNFGGLWEAGVKSFKHHFKRTVGSSILTLEEFNTVVVQIEGILNSRPLCPLPGGINEFEVLTPGHFLIGRSLLSLPEPEVTSVPVNRLSKWQQLTRHVQLIWKRWQRDVLNHLQQRNKWQVERDNIQPGTIVVIKEDNLPPCKWAIAKVIEPIKGKDNRVRVVRLRVPSGETLRAISKICVLPTQ